MRDLQKICANTSRESEERSEVLEQGQWKRGHGRVQTEEHMRTRPIGEGDHLTRPSSPTGSGTDDESKGMMNDLCNDLRPPQLLMIAGTASALTISHQDRPCGT